MKQVSESTNSLIHEQCTCLHIHKLQNISQLAPIQHLNVLQKPPSTRCSPTKSLRHEVCLEPAASRELWQTNGTDKVLTEPRLQSLWHKVYVDRRTSRAAAGDFGAVQCRALTACRRGGRLIPDKRHNAVGPVTAQPAAAVAGMALLQPSRYSYFPIHRISVWLRCNWGVLKCL